MCLMFLTQSQMCLTVSLCYAITLCHDYRLSVTMQTTWKGDSLKSPIFFWVVSGILTLWDILK